MSNRRLALVGAALAAASTAGAQAPEPPGLSLALLAGRSVSTGISRPAFGDGMHVGLAAQLRSPRPWLAWRVDLGLQRFGGRRMDVVLEPGAAPVGELRIRPQLSSATASAVFRTPALGRTVRPYAMIGGGLYRTTWIVGSSRFSAPADLENQSTTRPGVAGGVGAELRVGRLTTLVQARYEHVPQGPRVVPISLGARF